MQKRDKSGRFLAAKGQKKGKKSPIKANKSLRPVVCMSIKAVKELVQNELYSCLLNQYLKSSKLKSKPKSWWSTK